MENIGPLIFFLLYLVISAWAKQKKNKSIREKSQQDEFQTVEPNAPQSGPKVESIFDQIKRELFEQETAPQVADYLDEISPGEPVEPGSMDQARQEEPVFVEGVPAVHDQSQDKEVKFPEHQRKSISLVEILGSYTLIQQGILLHEILGKPKALQQNKEWFHSG